jgi:hypothetical protein
LKSDDPNAFGVAVQKTCEQVEGIGQFAAAPGSVENVRLCNDTKIRFCNALDALRRHAAEGTSGECAACSIYLRTGDGDLCEKGKDLIAREMAYTDTKIEFPPNAKLRDAGREASEQH